MLADSGIIRKFLFFFLFFFGNKMIKRGQTERKGGRERERKSERVRE